MENKDKLLAKIKKLMNLARKNTNPHEALLALERVQMRCLKHCRSLAARATSACMSA